MWQRWGIDPAWHRVVRVGLGDGSSVEWSILDTGVGERGTIVCVHGNPTWGYLWKGFLERLSPEWRVIAVDQTGMGWSQRTGPRTLEQRVEELVSFCEEHTDGPIVLAAHDWGGPVALGAASSLDVEAVILGNTGVGLPEQTSVPPLIATSRRFVDVVCRRSPLFVDGTAMMTSKQHRDALRAPYRSAERRRAVATFVADIPLSPNDPSWNALERSAQNLADLDVPLLLVWGGSDPVFHDRFLADIVRRAPHAEIHRFPEAGHLVPLDEPMAEVAASWLNGLGAFHDAAATSADPQPDPRDEHTFLPITAALFARSEDETAAFTDGGHVVSWREFAQRAHQVAHMLQNAGMEKGDRVAMLVPPSVELLVASYGVWLAGGVLVVADSGLGPRGLRRVLRGANLRWTFGTPATIAAAKTLGWTPGTRSVSTRRFPSAVSLATHSSRAELDLPVLEPGDEAAIVHTSGSTGPAKPVRYRHGALAAQRDTIREAFAMSADNGFITSFAPFILLGPALGVPCVLPEGDVTKPAELDFDRFARAIESSHVDVAWLSPASARRIVETAAGRTASLRLVMLAGAPITPELARSIGEVTGAEVRSPWGMTEAMPLTDGVGATRGVERGTVTGAPLRGVDVVVLSLDASGPQELASGQWGELAVRAPWMFDGYEKLWAVDHRSEVTIRGLRFHRTGDLGVIGVDGSLLQFGRVQHALGLPSGTIPSVFVEDPISARIDRQVAAVGIGPRGTQAIAIVIRGSGGLRLADVSTTQRVRSASEYEIAAVLEGELPVDVRHQSKIKREVLADEVTAFLAGR